MNETAAKSELGSKTSFWLGVSALFLGVTGPFAIYLGVRDWKAGQRSKRTALAIGMGAIGIFAFLVATLGGGDGGGVPASAASAPAAAAHPVEPSAPDTKPIAAAPTPKPVVDAPPTESPAEVVTKPVAWLELPKATLVEMQDRLAELKSIHADATRLPRVERTEGLGPAGALMRQLQAKCKAADADYELRFGAFSPWPGFESDSPAGRAHLAMRGAIAHVCGVCPTLLDDASDACKRAGRPLQEASRALSKWKKALAR